MQDYAVLFRRKSRKMSAQEKLKKIRHVLKTRLPTTIMVMLIMMLVDSRR